MMEGMTWQFWFVNVMIKRIANFSNAQMFSDFQFAGNASRLSGLLCNTMLLIKARASQHRAAQCKSETENTQLVFYARVDSVDLFRLVDVLCLHTFGETEIRSQGKSRKCIWKQQTLIASIDFHIKSIDAIPKFYSAGMKPLSVICAANLAVVFSQIYVHHSQPFNSDIISNIEVAFFFLSTHFRERL